jgi:HEAT repeat protein
MINILGDIGHSSTLKHLDRLATHPEPRVREETLQVLPKFGRKAQGLIQEFLEDAVPEIRGKASLVLARTIKDEAVRPLSQIILSDDFYRRAYDEKVSFFRALGETGSREAVPILEKIAKKRNWFRKSKWEEMRLCATNTLRMMETEKKWQGPPVRPAAIVQKQ